MLCTVRLAGGGWLTGAKKIRLCDLSQQVEKRRCGGGGGSGGDGDACRVHTKDTSFPSDGFFFS